MIGNDGDFVRRVARFNRVFLSSHRTDRRYVLLMGGAGSGKSVDTAQFLLLKALLDRQCNVLVVRKVFGSHLNSTFAELSAAVERMGLGEYFEILRSVPEIRTKNGNGFLFCGCNDERQREKLKSINAASGKITDIWIEEATELSLADFQMLDDRLRGQLAEGGFFQIRMTFNPVSSSHWIKKHFFDSPDEQTFLCRSTYLDNRFCDREYHKRMQRRKRDDPEGYRIYGLGEWGECGGLILPNIEVREFERGAGAFDAVSMGQDFGFNNPNAVLELGLLDGDVYICRESYFTGMDTAELIGRAEAAGFDKRVVMYCDSAEPDRILSWCRAGWRAVSAYKAAGSVAAEIDWLKQRKIFLHPECVNSLRELQAWRWRQDRNGGYTDEPVCADDHAIAALRYGTQAWRKIQPKGVKSGPEKGEGAFFIRRRSSGGKRERI